MPFLKKKFVKILIYVVLGCVILSGAAYFGNNPVQRALYTVVSPIFNSAYSAVTPVREFFKYLSEAKTYEEKIESLDGGCHPAASARSQCSAGASCISH